MGRPDGREEILTDSFYSQSKFANILFGLELDRRLRAAGSAVRSIITHPGYAATNLQTTGPTIQAVDCADITSLDTFSIGCPIGDRSTVFETETPPVRDVAGLFVGRS